MVGDSFDCKADFKLLCNSVCCDKMGRNDPENFKVIQRHNFVLFYFLMF